MKTRYFKWMLGLLACPTATAFSQILLTYEFNGLNIGVPDNNLSGASNSQLVVAPDKPILDINITIDLAPLEFSAYDGDYYAYLSHNGKISVLLNRIGRTSANKLGVPGNGFVNVTFDDAAPPGDIHLALANAFSPVTGVWQPDGRATFPTQTVASDARTETLSQFNGENANGQWTLFVADLSGGGFASIQSWGMQVTVVPEASSIGLAAGAGLLAFGLVRRRLSIVRK
jgi:subtilisin-like proprotein convertase family protein